MSENKQQLEVIWIGLPIMQGHSYKDTLNILGYNTFDVMTIFNKGQSNEWRDIFLRRKNYNFELYGDCNATIHLVRYFYKELLEEYPNAKFIVEEMDNQTWYRYFKKLKRALTFLVFLRFFKRTRDLLDFITLNIYSVTEMPVYKQNPKEAWDVTIQEIKTNIPANQLLIFSSKDGWKPICDFLDKPIPSVPLPINSHSAAKNRAHQRLIFNKSTRGQIIIIIYLLVLISIFVYLGFFYQ